jgi:hypothetical protein
VKELKVYSSICLIKRELAVIILQQGYSRATVSPHDHLVRPSQCVCARKQYLAGVRVYCSIVRVLVVVCHNFTLLEFFLAYFP